MVVKGIFSTNQSVTTNLTTVIASGQETSSMEQKNMQLRDAFSCLTKLHDERKSFLEQIVLAHRSLDRMFYDDEIIMQTLNNVNFAKGNCLHWELSERLDGSIHSQLQILTKKQNSNRRISDRLNEINENCQNKFSCTEKKLLEYIQKLSTPELRADENVITNGEEFIKWIMSQEQFAILLKDAFLQVSSLMKPPTPPPPPPPKVPKFVVPVFVPSQYKNRLKTPIQETLISLKNLSERRKVNCQFPIVAEPRTPDDDDAQGDFALVVAPFIGRINWVERKLMFRIKPAFDNKRCLVNFQQQESGTLRKTPSEKNMAEAEGFDEQIENIIDVYHGRDGKLRRNERGGDLIDENKRNLEQLLQLIMDRCEEIL